VYTSVDTSDKEESTNLDSEHLDCTKESLSNSNLDISVFGCNKMVDLINTKHQHGILVACQLDYLATDLEGQGPNKHEDR